jgi:glycosyltransferase involved in cell wall biosynthesis
MTGLLDQNPRSLSKEDTKRVLCVMRWPVGGIRTYILYNYPLLVKASFRFTFLGPADDSFRSFREEIAFWEGAEFVEAPIGRNRRCRLWPAVRRQLRTRRFALVHSQGFTAAFHSLVGGVGIRVPHIVTSHDVIRPVQFLGSVGRAKLQVFGGILRRADAIVSVSEDAQQNILEYLPSLRKSRCELITIPHGIDLSRFAAVRALGPQGDGLRGQLGLGEDVVLVGFLGRFMEQKGFLLLLDALEILQRDHVDRPYHLVAVGSGDYEREYQRETDRRGLGNIVSFREVMANPSRILQQLDLLVMPSLWEAAGLLAMEAMVLGIPVLGSNCIGLREVLEGTPAIVVSVGDVTALSRALRETIANLPTQAARAFVSEASRRFDAQKSSQRLSEVFDRYCRGAR